MVFQLAVHFDDAQAQRVTGLTFGDIVQEPAGGVVPVSGVAESGLDSTILLRFTSEGRVSFSIPAGVARDDANNTNVASNTSLSVIFDSTLPTVTPLEVTGDTTKLVVFTVVDSVALDGQVLHAGALSLEPTENRGGATVGSPECELITASPNALRCTARVSGVTPALGELVLVLAAGAARDRAGNGNAETTLAILNSDGRCGPGELLAVDGSCTRCPIGTYMDAEAHSNTGCTPCDGITEWQDLEGSAACNAPTTCQPGQYVTAQPTSTSDRACAGCSRSTYTDDDAGSCAE